MVCSALVAGGNRAAALGLGLIGLAAACNAVWGVDQLDYLGGATGTSNTMTTGGTSAGGGGHGADGGGGSGAGTGGSVVQHLSCEGMSALCLDDGSPVSCCSDKVVTGGAFEMGRGEGGSDSYTIGSPNEAPEHAATITTFSFDTFEVTVGRFRSFVEAYETVTPPAPGAGRHPLIADSGWQSEWNASLPPTRAQLVTSLGCSGGITFWTAEAGEHELKPMSCVSWYEAFAFCVWDGGRLPTEGEAEYAAAGGSQDRLYPWGADAPDASQCVFNCVADGSAAGDCAFGDILDVGSRPAGKGRYGHHDLGGSMREWALDWYSPSWYDTFGPCDDCANLDDSSATARSARNGSWRGDGGQQRAAFRSGLSPSDRADHVGFRCARGP